MATAFKNSVLNHTIHVTSGIRKMADINFLPGQVPSKCGTRATAIFITDSLKSIINLLSSFEHLCCP